MASPSLTAPVRAGTGKDEAGRGASLTADENGPKCGRSTATGQGDPRQVRAWRGMRSGNPWN
jgi:hypothetical protein